MVEVVDVTRDEGMVEVVMLQDMREWWRWLMLQEMREEMEVVDVTRDEGMVEVVMLQELRECTKYWHTHYMT